METSKYSNKKGKKRANINEKANLGPTLYETEGDRDKEFSVKELFTTGKGPLEIEKKFNKDRYSE